MVAAAIAGSRSTRRRGRRHALAAAGASGGRRGGARHRGAARAGALLGSPAPLDSAGRGGPTAHRSRHHV